MEIRENEKEIKKILREKSVSFSEQFTKMQEIFSMKCYKIFNDRDYILRIDENELNIIYKFISDGPEFSFESFDEHTKNIVAFIFILTLMEFHRYEIYLFDGIDDVCKNINIIKS